MSFYMLVVVGVVGSNTISLICLSRKIEIVQFASRTRQQFVRLLALVKWAASADRVDKCQVSTSVW